MKKEAQMNEVAKKIKNRTTALFLAGLSLCGGLTKTTDAAATNKQNIIEKSTSIDATHRFYKSFSDSFKSCHESIHMRIITPEGKMRSFSQTKNLHIADMGDDYSIIRKSSQTVEINSEKQNFQQEYDLLLATPRGDTLDLSFYNTKDFMLPATVDMYSGQTTVCSQDEVKAANDRWELKQQLLAQKNLKNPEDRKVFMQFVQQERSFLEKAVGELDEPIIVAKQERTHGKISNYRMTLSESGQNPEKFKSLRQQYKSIKETYNNIKKESAKKELTVASLQIQR